MALVVPDTGVLIELFRDARAVAEKERQRWTFRVSAVVHSELARGALTPSEKRFVDSLARAFNPVAPTSSQWAKCGSVLSQLHRDHQYDRRGMQLIQNNVLIALTARELGLPLVTMNESDFVLIAGYVRGLNVIAFAP